MPHMNPFPSLIKHEDDTHRSLHLGWCRKRAKAKNHNNGYCTTALHTKRETGRQPMSTGCFARVRFLCQARETQPASTAAAYPSYHSGFHVTLHSRPHGRRVVYGKPRRVTTAYWVSILIIATKSRGTQGMQTEALRTTCKHRRCSGTAPSAGLHDP